MQTPRFIRTRLLCFFFGFPLLAIVAALGQGSPVDHFEIVGVGSQQMVDTAFPITVTAMDAQGNLLNDFSGPVVVGALLPVPRPAIGVGQSGSGSPSGFSAAARARRVQTIYLPGEVGGAGRLTSMGLNIASVPTATYSNFTLRLKHTNKAEHSDGWEDSGWTTVFQGDVQFTTSGWREFPFAVPFEFDGTSNLMVDFSSFDAGLGTGGSYVFTVVSGPRKYYPFTSFSGDPKAWPSSYPALSSGNIPNVRFSTDSLRSVIRGTTLAAFSNGTWTGYISVPFAESGVRIYAENTAGVFGESPRFNVLSAPRVPVVGTISGENWETTPTSSAWVFSGTNSFRTQTTALNGPRAGLRHLTMDSSASSSRNEATWTNDLSGQSGLTLKFWAKGFSEFPDGPPPVPFTTGANFDGVAISANGTTWYEVQGLRSLSSSWVQYTVDLDTALRTYGLSYGTGFKIRFNQYGSDYIPYKGIAIDDIELISAPKAGGIAVSLPAQMSENGATLSGSVSLPFAVSFAVVVTLSNTVPAKLSIPAQVTIPAGQTSASFAIQPINDSIADGNRNVGIIASAANFQTFGSSLLMTDDDLAGFTFTVSSNTVTEGSPAIKGTITSPSAAAAPIVLNVASSNTTAVTVPATVTIPLGKTAVEFSISAVNDSKIDGTQTSNVTVSLAGFSSQVAAISVLDNETTLLRLTSTISPAPTSAQEGAGGRSFQTALPGTVTTATTITFSSSSPRVTPPAAVTVAAGSTGLTTVSFQVLENTIADGNEDVILTASAPGFTSATYTLSILDNDPHHFEFATIASPQIGGAEIPITVTAKDVNGNTVTGFSQAIALTANAAISPATLAGSVNGVWTGNVRVNALASGVVLTASDGVGHTGTSNAFDVGMGPFVRFEWDAIASPQRPGAPIYLGVKSTDAGGNLISTVNEPLTIRALSPIPETAIGAGANSAGNPLNVSSLRNRTEVIYLASEVGGARTLAGLSWNVSFADRQILKNFTVRLKHTQRTTLSSATGWEGDGWTIVHQSTQVITSNGWLDFFFDRSFEYDGVSHLHVDVSFDNSFSNSTAVGWKYDSTYPERVLLTSNPAATSPLTWAGASPESYMGSYLPQARFHSLTPVAATLPGAPALAGGVWTGEGRFDGRLNRVFFEALDSAGHRGISNGVEVEGPGKVGAAVPFADGFETGAFSPFWTATTFNTGRARIVSTDAPHSGTQHVILDSENNWARKELDLSLNLFGRTGVVLTFWAKSFSQFSTAPSNPFYGGANFDGVAMSADGLQWHEIQSLRSTTIGQWTQFTVNLDTAIAARGLSYNQAFKIRFNNYCSSSAPTNGVAIDDVSVTANTAGQVAVTLPMTVSENGGPVSGTITLDAASGADTVVSLVSSSPIGLSVPASVTIPAGQTTASFTASPLDNLSINGIVAVSVTASISGTIVGIGGTQVLDDETVSLAISIPVTIDETDGSLDGVVTISPASPFSQTLVLTSSLLATIRVPQTVTLSPGQTTAPFTATVVNDNYINGTRSVSIAAALANWPVASATVAVSDDETPAFTTFSSATVNEGSTTTFQLNTDGYVSANLLVTLVSSDPARVTVPATITIPAGQKIFHVTFAGVENSLADGRQQVTVTASAAGFPSFAATVFVNDNEPHHLEFSVIPTQVRGRPFNATVTARTVDNYLLSSYSGTATLSAIGDAGAISMTPPTVTLSSGTWTGSVTATTFSTNARLTATVSPTLAGTSNAFDVATGPLHHYGWSNIPSPQVVGQPFNATITAYDIANNVVTNQSGYALLSTTGPERVIGSGTSSTTTFPVYAYTHEERTQALYFASELGSAGSLSSLSLYFATLPSTLNAWTIRLKHTTRTSLSPASWETGWTTAHSSNQTISQTGWVTFNFPTPFTYNGTDNLLVDFSFNNSAYGTEASVRYFTSQVTRTNYQVTYGFNGDPLLWSGTSPSLATSTSVPQLILNRGQVTSVTPSLKAVFIQNGSWTGSINLPQGSVAPLAATDFSGVTGSSNNFSINTAADADSDKLPDWWETENSLGNGAAGDNGPDGDPDKDGQSNLLEYALNSNPMANSTNHLPIGFVQQNPADGQYYLTFNYRRRIGINSLNYAIQTSSDCISWTPDGSTYQQLGAMPLGDGSTEEISVRVLPAISTGNAGRFVRLRVTAQ